MGQFNNSKVSSICSSQLGAVTLELDATGYANGPNTECRWAIVKAGNNMYLDGVSSVSVDSYPLTADEMVKLNIDNLSMLHFYGTSSTKVYILYGS